MAMLPSVGARTVVQALLLQAFEEYEAVLNPAVKATAKQLWGGEGAPLPQWLYKCHQCLGYSMKQHVTADSHWDTYTLGAVVTAHLRHFLPASLQDDDAASEMHRCAHAPVSVLSPCSQHLLLLHVPPHIASFTISPPSCLLFLSQASMPSSCSTLMIMAPACVVGTTCTM